MVVVLPAPLGPRKATTSPGSSSRSMPRTAWTLPKLLVTPWSRTACLGVLPGGTMSVPEAGAACCW